MIYLQVYKVKLTMGRIHQVIAATPLGVLARGGVVATLEVQTLRASQAIGAAAISRRSLIPRVNNNGPTQ